MSHNPKIYINFFLAALIYVQNLQMQHVVKEQL